jgi:hypothetical protein
MNGTGEERIVGVCSSFRVLFPRPRSIEMKIYSFQYLAPFLGWKREQKQQQHQM